MRAWFGAMLFAVFCLVAPMPAFAEGARILVVRPVDETHIVREAAERLRAELLASGFDVVMVDAEKGANPSQTVEHSWLGAVAALTIVPTEEGAAIDVWVADKLKDKTLARKVVVDARSVPDAATVLAVRAVELLHVSLLEVQPAAQPAPAEPDGSPDNAAPDPAPSTSPKTARRGTPLPPSSRENPWEGSPTPAPEQAKHPSHPIVERVTVGAGFASLFHLDGNPPVLGPTFGVRIAFSPEWSIRADIFAPLATWARLGTGGWISLVEGFGGAGVAYALVSHGPVIPSLHAELGVDVAHATGHAECWALPAPCTAYPARSQTVPLFSGMLGASVEVACGKYASIFADFRAVVMAPGAKLEVFREQVGTVGPLSLVPTVGVAISP